MQITYYNKECKVCEIIRDFTLFLFKMFISLAGNCEIVIMQSFLFTLSYFNIVRKSNEPAGINAAGS